MKKYKFKAKIQAGDSGGAHVLFPYDVQQEFGVKGKVPIQATFNGVPYAGSLVKYGNPLHMLHILKAIRERLGLTPGDTVSVELSKDDQPRTVEVPAPLKTALEESGVLPLFDRLSYSHRREYCRWISEAKKEETRSSRVHKAIEMLKTGVRTPNEPSSLAGGRKQSARLGTRSPGH